LSRGCQSLRARGGNWPKLICSRSSPVKKSGSSDITTSSLAATPDGQDCKRRVPMHPTPCRKVIDSSGQDPTRSPTKAEAVAGAFAVHSERPRIPQSVGNTGIKVRRTIARWRSIETLDAWCGGPQPALDAKQAAHLGIEPLIANWFTGSTDSTWRDAVRPSRTQRPAVVWRSTLGGAPMA
jgi:hypothetical protein